MFSRFKLKRAKPHDSKKIAKLFADIDSDMSHEKVKDLIEKERVLVLKKNKQIKAALSFLALGAGICSLLYVRKLAVDKNERGQGIGSHLLERIKKHAKKKEHDGFFLCCTNKKAQPFYERNRLKTLLTLGGFTWFWWRKRKKK